MTSVETISVPAHNDFWINPFNNASLNLKRRMLEDLLMANENFIKMAVDLTECHLEAGNKERVKLVTLLRYFLNGSLLVHENAAFGPGSKSRARIQLFEKIGARLTELQSLLESLEEDMGKGLPTDPNNRDNCLLPNNQTIELLALCIMQTPGSDRSAKFDLKELKSRMLDTQIVRHQSANPMPRRQIGLPKVIFVCSEHRMIACSADYWGEFGAFKTAMRNFRLQRFNESSRSALSNERDLVFRRFTYVKNAMEKMTPGFKQMAFNRQLGPALYNQFVSYMYEWLPTGSTHSMSGRGNLPLGRRFGHNHLGETGRSFHGAGVNMFHEMSRCWKCRFLYQYDTPRPGMPNATGLIAEEPTQTAWNCNPPLTCAEDLCHHFCRALQGSDVNSSRDLVFLPYP